MPTWKRRVSEISVLLVPLLLIMFFVVRDNKAVSKTEPRPGHGALPYSARGPHTVGIQGMVIESEVPLEITIWYPANLDASKEAAITYPYEIKIGEPFGTATIASFTGQAIHEAPYNLSADPYPLIVLSPGFSIGSSAYAWLAEHLASYGFIVISPEHHEYLDPQNQLWQSAITRPQDILTVLTTIKDQNAFEGLIDTDRVAVIGHSYGGYTALAAAGAQIDTAGFTTHCERASKAQDPAAWLCDALMPHLGDMAALAGFDSIPKKRWPARADPRIDAAVSLAGDAFFFGQDGLAGIDIPVMAIGGTADADSPFMWGTHPTYEYVSTPTKAKVALIGAGHMVFTGPCESIRWYLKFISGEFCADESWDRLYAHALTSHFTTIFLLAELKHDRAAAAALAPDVVEFTRVTYEAQGY